MMDHNRTEESAAIEEIELATKHLKAAYAAVLNKFARIAKKPDLKINSADTELNELDIARQRFDRARTQMDKITEEIRVGIRK